jgi:hypothetical protein
MSNANVFVEVQTCFSCRIVHEAQTKGFARLLSLLWSRRTTQSSRLVVPSNTQEQRLDDAV